MERLLTGLESVTGFNGLFDIARHYALQFTIIHTHSRVYSHVFSAVAW